MSGGGGVGKVFKKVAKVFTKVAPVVLAAAAVVFTAGAALGVTATLGTAMSGLAGSMGLSGTLGSVVAGALTSASYGSLVGGGLAGLTGGNVMKGMQMGALTGAVTGGVTGGFSGPLGEGASLSNMGAGSEAASFGAKIDPIGNWASGKLDFSTPSAVTPDASTVTGGAGNANLGGGAGADTLVPGASPGAQEANSLVMNSPASVAPHGYSEMVDGVVTKAGGVGGTPINTGGGLLSFAERNPNLVGNAAGGLFQGAGNYFAGQDQAEAQKEAAQELINGKMQLQDNEAARIAANYANPQGGGLLTQQNMTYMQGDDGTRPTPTQRYDTRSYNGQWVYDSRQGKIVFMQNAATA